jgi:hypothetical protein
MCRFLYVILLTNVAYAGHGKEETAIAVYWVTDGIDHCRVGILRRHCVKHKHLYEGKFAQLVDFLEGSKSVYDRRLDHKIRGIAMASLLD